MTQALLLTIVDIIKAKVHPIYLNLNLFISLHISSYLFISLHILVPDLTRRIDE